jgi:predicted HTH transcriptional regulator
MCKEYDLQEPEFIEIGMDFRVNLYRKQNAEKQLIGDGKQLIGDGKQLIGDRKQLVEIQKQLIYSIEGKTVTKENAWMVFEKLQNETVFGRTEIMKITGLSSNAAGELLNKLKVAKLIVPVSGKGKGKYIFALEVS